MREEDATIVRVISGSPIIHYHLFLTMTSIYINGLRLTAHHGVMAQERRVGNEFEINIRLDVPSASNAMDSDSINDTINYADVVDIVKREMAVPSSLIEHVCGRIRGSIIQTYGEMVVGGMVSVAKLAPPIAAQVQSVAFSVSW